jgi:outer membrane protein
VQAEFYRELTFVYKDVHDAYLNSMQAENLIAETTDQVAYAEEGLRVAQLRFAEGVGTYIDVINSQRNWINALVSKAQALINFNISQTKLVRSVGRVSVDTLATTGSISSVK